MDVRNDATYGLAVYFEFENPEHVWQYLVIPQTRHPDTGEVVKTLSMSRDLTVQNPRRKWKYSEVKAELNPLSTSHLDVLNDAINVLAEWAPNFEALVLQGWKLRTQPLIVALSQDDVRDIARRETTPDGLMRRLFNVRDKAGLPALVTEGLNPTKKTETF